MSQTFTVTSIRNRELETVLLMDGQSETISFDLSPWEADNASVSAVTWSVESGSISISGESLSSSVASALITGSSAGKSLVKLTCTTTSPVLILYLVVFVRDPQVVIYGGSDYV